MTIPAVRAENLTRRFGEVTALDGVSVAVERGEFFSLLGPSGCGKTTLLRIIAGLDHPDSGNLQLSGKEALPIPPHHRAVNTVFQSYALFPHLSVRENVSFGLRMKKLPHGEIDKRVHAVMELTRISELARRKPAELSGGQKQRTALARALVNEPEVLLLDEPLAALDLKLRKELQAELCQLQRRTGITFIYVTHDQDEALSMSDRIAVMNHGQIVQLGAGAELYSRPRNRFVAQFLGGCNLIEAQLNGGRATTAFGALQLNSLPTPRTKLTLAIRPEHIALDTPSAPNSFAGRIVETTYTGPETQHAISVGEGLLRVTVVNAPGASRKKVGDSVSVTLPASGLTVLED